MSWHWQVVSTQDYFVGVFFGTQLGIGFSIIFSAAWPKMKKWLKRKL